MIKTRLGFDAENEQLLLWDEDAAGVVFKDLPQVRIKLSDMQYARQVGTAPDQPPIQMVCRRAHYTRPDGKKVRVMIPSTIEEDDTTDDGHSTTAVDPTNGDPPFQDLYLGGAGEVIPCHITHLYSTGGSKVNYFGATRLDDSGTEYGDEIMVAKSPPAWMVDSLGSDTFTYISDNERTVDGSSPLVHEFITEAFAVGQLVFVAPVRYSGVVTAGESPVQVKFICLRTEREWTEPE